jgi:hypothetical protein
VSERVEDAGRECRSRMRAVQADRGAAGISPAWSARA